MRDGAAVLGAARRHLVASQIPRSRLEQADDLRAVPRRRRLLRPMAAEVLDAASEPGGIVVRRRPAGARHKFVERDRALGCFGPADTAFPVILDDDLVIGESYRNHNDSAFH